MQQNQVKGLQGIKIVDLLIVYQVPLLYRSENTCLISWKAYGEQPVQPKGMVPPPDKMPAP